MQGLQPLRLCLSFPSAMGTPLQLQGWVVWGHPHCPWGLCG